MLKIFFCKKQRSMFCTYDINEIAQKIGIDVQLNVAITDLRGLRIVANIGSSRKECQGTDAKSAFSLLLLSVFAGIYCIVIRNPYQGSLMTLSIGHPF